MKRRKVLAMLMTAVMTFTSVAPETALVAFAEGEEAAEEDEDVVVEELPFDLKGMPEGYVLSQEQLEMKAALKENDVLAKLAGMTEGVDYEAGTMFCLADSEEEAQMIAEAYNAELTLYAQGVAEFKLPETVSVAQALSVAQDPAYAMPVIEPNYLTYLDMPVDYSLDAPEFVEVDEEYAQGKTPIKSWEDYVLGKDGGKAVFDNPDTYIKDPSSPYYQWYLQDIGVYDAWETTTGKGVTVAVIDTGVYPNNPDLQGRVTQIKVGNINPSTYSHSHGTHVAGIIGATANNGTGVAGIAPDVNIVSLNVFGANEGCEAADEARAMIICKEQKIDVANLSLGGHAYSANAEKAMKEAVAAGVNVFVAMGNYNAEAKFFPACYEGAIAVASTNPAGKRSYFSNFGSWVDIAAPGTDIMSCYNPTVDNSDGDVDASGNYGLMSGTSMACPVAAGVAALYLSKNGKKTAAETLKAMQNSATKTSSKKIGKIVNAGKLIGSGSGKAKATQSEDYMSFTIDIEGVEGDAYAVYTTDGSDPAFLGGELVNGQVYTESVELVPAEGASTITVKTRVVADGSISETETYTFNVAGVETEDNVAAKKAAGVVVTDASGRLDAKNKAQIFTANLSTTDVVDNELTLTAASSVTWSSSNASVLSVSATEGTTTTVKALKKGSAKITAQAADGSKTVITIKAVVPVSGLDISVDGFYGGQLALGKSKKLDVVVGDEYGKPAVKKLKWDYTVGNATVDSALKAAKAVKISSKGKVSINKKKWEKAIGTQFTIGKQVVLYVNATTTDGSNISDQVALIVHNAPTVMSLVDKSTGKAGLKSITLIKGYPKEAWFNDGDNDYLAAEVAYVAVDAINANDVDVEVSSSNPDVIGVRSLGVERDSAGKVKVYTLTIRQGFSVTKKDVCLYQIALIAGNTEPVKKSVSSKITVKLLDGSNKKISFKANLPK